MFTTRAIISLVFASVLFIVVLAAYVPLGHCVTCFLSGEQVSGLNKICYYSCPTGDAAITISSVQLCPLSINR